MKDLRYMSISINTEEPGIVSSRIPNTILKRVMWIQSQVYWQKIIVGVSVSLFMYTPVVTEIICRCIFIVYNIPLFHHVNTTFHSLTLWNYIKHAGSWRILHVEIQKQETKKTFRKLRERDLFSQVPTQEVSDVNMVLYHQRHWKKSQNPPKFNDNGLCIFFLLQLLPS